MTLTDTGAGADRGLASLFHGLHVGRVVLGLLLCSLCAATWQGMVVTGAVFDAWGRPVAGATVTISGLYLLPQGYRYSAAVSTDNSGHFGPLTVPQGRYALLVERAGFVPLSLSPDMTGLPPQRADIVLQGTGGPGSPQPPSPPRPPPPPNRATAPKPGSVLFDLAAMAFLAAVVWAVVAWAQRRTSTPGTVPESTQKPKLSWRLQVREANAAGKVSPTGSLELVSDPPEESVGDHDVAAQGQQIPYIVLPVELLQRGDIKTGDVARVRVRGATAYAIVKSPGPRLPAGTISNTLTELLRVKHAAGAALGADETEYVVLPDSGKNYNTGNQEVTAQSIQEIGQVAFADAKKAGLVD